MTVTELLDWVVMTYYNIAITCGVAFYVGLQLVITVRLVLALAEWLGASLIQLYTKVETRLKA